MPTYAENRFGSVEAATYKVATGYDNCAGLTTLDPQPYMRGITPGLRRQDGDGMTHEDGFKTATLQFGYLTRPQFEAVKTAFGLDSSGAGSTPSARITIQLPSGPMRTAVVYNGIVDDPGEPDNARFESSVWQEISFTVRRLRKITC